MIFPWLCGPDLTPRIAKLRVCPASEFPDREERLDLEQKFQSDQSLSQDRLMVSDLRPGLVRLIVRTDRGDVSYAFSLKESEPLLLKLDVQQGTVSSSSSIVVDVTTISEGNE